MALYGCDQCMRFQDQIEAFTDLLRRIRIIASDGSLPAERKAQDIAGMIDPDRPEMSIYKKTHDLKREDS